MELFQATRPRRRPSLTPMIDVVFLLLVFFMLASRFGAESILQLPLASQGGSYDGPPRLVSIFPEKIELNGRPVDALPMALKPMMSSPTDMIILRGKGGANLQRIVDVSDILKVAGYASIVLVE